MTNDSPELIGRYFFASEVYDGFLYICGGLNDTNYNGGNFSIIDCDEERVDNRIKEKLEKEKAQNSHKEKANIGLQIFKKETQASISDAKSDRDI